MKKWKYLVVCQECFIVSIHVLGRIPAPTSALFSSSETHDDAYEKSLSPKRIVSTQARFIECRIRSNTHDDTQTHALPRAHTQRHHLFFHLLSTWPQKNQPLALPVRIIARVFVFPLPTPTHSTSPLRDVGNNANPPSSPPLKGNWLQEGLSHIREIGLIFYSDVIRTSQLIFQLLLPVNCYSASPHSSPCAP